MSGYENKNSVVGSDFAGAYVVRGCGRTHIYTLFSDPALREGKQGFAGWFRDLEVLHDCNFDGLGSQGIHMDQLRLLDVYPFRRLGIPEKMSGFNGFLRAFKITHAAGL